MTATAGVVSFLDELRHTASILEQDRRALAERRPGLRGIHQTVFASKPPFTDDNPPGNCTQAAVATLLGLQLEDVPHFVDLTIGDPRPGAWWPVFESWSREYHGVGWISVEPEDALAVEWEVAATEVLLLGGGFTHRGTKHSIVIDGNLNLVWDPNPGGNGVVKLIDVDLPIEPDPISTSPNGDPIWRILNLEQLRK